VVLITGHARIADVKAALRAGAFDYVVKPFDISYPRQIAARIEESQAIDSARREARGMLGERSNAEIVGRSPVMVRLLERIDTISQSDAPVLLTGESGTGKELIARAIVAHSPRRHKPFVAVNCAALPESLIEAELFGHERGAFTGALKKRDGRFKAADGGTLLLDEVAEISPVVQTKLLRVLQEGVIEPVGGNAPVLVDVRIISATHQDLKERMNDGRFRSDLYYRLNVLDMRVPALRDRRSDLPLLFEHFLRRFAPEGQEQQITNRAWKRLVEYPFPGNVRELAHAVERAVVLSRGSDIDIEHLPPDIAGSIPTTPHAEPLEPLAAAARRFERDYLLRALNAAGGRRGRAAQLLGISRKNLWEKLRAHGIADADLDEQN
jgi:DNA-binding NtrC family response regulator